MNSAETVAIYAGDKTDINDKAIKINRGDICLADLGRTVGSEQGGIRPVLVFQNVEIDNDSTTITVIPITSKGKKKLPTHVYISKNDGVVKDSIILVESVTTIPKDSIKKKLGCINNKDVMKKVSVALCIQAGINSDILMGL